MSTKTKATNPYGHPAPESIAAKGTNTRTMQDVVWGSESDVPLSTVERWHASQVTLESGTARADR